jgi:predicted DNA-binding protein
MTNFVRMDFMLPAWLKQALKKLAEEKGVNVSEYIRDILKEHANRVGKK